MYKVYKTALQRCVTYTALERVSFDVILAMPDMALYPAGSMLLQAGKACSPEAVEVAKLQGQGITSMLLDSPTQWISLRYDSSPSTVASPCIQLEVSSGYLRRDQAQYSMDTCIPSPFLNTLFSGPC